VLTEVASVPVLVSDAKKTAAWYKEKLGFEVGADGHWVTVRPRGSKLLIHLCEKCREWGDDRPGGTTGIGFYADDLQRTYDELRAKGVKFKIEPTAGKSRTYALFEDPDGNEFWIWGSPLPGTPH
jgi:catechol 2,3-dioxygenase-like lactoylglutathione lyase family enzyme